MQPITYETEAERSRVGRHNRLMTIAKTRKRGKRKLTELGFDWVALVIIACSAYGFFTIGKGIGPVLRAHGL